MNRKIADSARVNSIQAYLADNKSLREKAQELDVHYVTLFRWVKRYKNGGEELLNKLHTTYHRPNTLSLKTEELIVKPKEERPALTIHQARQMLNTDGIKVSSKTIWQVWQKYGFIGFRKEKFANNFRLYITKNPKTIPRAQTALKYLQNGDIKKAAKIVNSLPYCAIDEVLEMIPDRFLNLKKRIEKLPLMFGKLSYSEFRKKAHILRYRAERRHLNYSALRAGMMELLASGWIGDPEYQLSLAQHLENLLDLTNNNRFSDLGLLLTILIYEGRAYIGHLNIKEAIKYARRSKRILKNRCAPNIKRTLSTLFATLELNNEANELIKKARSECTEDYEKSNCDLLRAKYEAIAGNYHIARDVLKSRAALQTRWNASSYSLIKAVCTLGQGKLQKAQRYANLALDQSQKTGLRTNLHFSSLVYASAYMYLGEEKKAYSLLTRFNSWFAKYNMKKYLTLRFLLSKPNTNVLSDHKLNLTADSHLVVLLNNAEKSKKYHDYIKSWRHAKAKYIMGIFHQVAPFYAPLISNVLNKHKPTGLPAALLRLPVFNKETPAYHIKFIGSLVIYKNQKYLRVNLKPKDAAFLIYLASRIPERIQTITLEDIYMNFWSKSKNFSRNLSHLLVRLKKELRIPSHLLKITHKTGEPMLVNRGIHFITDYSEFEQILTLAKALERAGDWAFAKREYLRAFRLFRGEPFKKMYDNWSEQMRRVILGKLEKEALSFVKSCLKYKNTKNAKKILETILKTISNSIETQAIFRNNF
ncbi:MAG: helix-turn-helix domain-containing protein [bacterium]